MSTKPRLLTEAEIDAVAGGACVIGATGQVKLLEQAAFFKIDALPSQWHGITGLLGHAGPSTGCLSLFPTG